MSKRTLAIGDIHGCYYTFCELLEAMRFNPAEDRLVCVGDYIDRGPHSCAVVEKLIHLQERYGKDNIICLKGNHEQLAVAANGLPDWDWDRNGGEETRLSYHEHRDLLPKHLEWFSTLPVYFETEHNIFCHAGLSEPKLADNNKYAMLWGRDWLEDDTRPREKCVVFGHTPFEKVPYFTATGDVGIDGGCVFGFNLCGLVIDEDGNAESFIIRKSAADNTMCI